MMQDIAELKEGGGRAIKKPKRVMEHHAFVRLHNEKPVVKIEKVWVENKGRDNENVLCRLAYIDSIEKDEQGNPKQVEKTAEVNYLDFLNDADKLKVKIIKQEAKDKTFSQGMSPKVDIETDSIVKGVEIDMEVVVIEYDCEVEFLEGDTLRGQVITMSNEGLNI